MNEVPKMFRTRNVGLLGERVIHIPKEAPSGYYSIQYDENTGIIKYVPVRQTCDV